MMQKFTTSDYNKSMCDILDAKIKEKGLVHKLAIARFINNNNKQQLAKQDKIVRLQAFDSNYFRAKSHFEDDGTQNCLEDDGTQNYLVCQPIYRDTLKIDSTEHIWKYGNPLLHLIRVLLQE